MKIATIVGARPQFVKAAVVSRAMERRGDAAAECLIHTGQHFDTNMSKIFFEEMGIRAPDRHLGIAGGGHGAMTGRMLEQIEVVLQDVQPDWVLIYGDTNSTLAGALAAAKLHIPVAHVEAGLRSFNRRMPEEINRVVADSVSNVLFAPTAAAVRNLELEGVAAERIVRVGDVMFDVTLLFRETIGDGREAVARLGLEPGGYVLATVHRAENTDDPKRLRGVIGGLEAIAATMPVVCPLHPRTSGAMESLGLAPQLIRFIDPVGYLEMASLEMNAAVIATDSGGVQKEAYFHGVPCLTLRDETEWVELIGAGANRLVGADTDAIIAGHEEALRSPVETGDLYGRGDAAEKIVEQLVAGVPGSPQVATAM
ncbi:MAG: non-hydrolyzing UDP-N-acetylglucosamine 2-epimerase [Planctomycetota bacterium]